MPFNTTESGFTEVTPRHLKKAKQFFIDHPEEVFLSRKDPRMQKEKLKNSFIYDKTKKVLYVKENTHSDDKTDRYLGHGVFGKVKKAQDTQGHFYALKISNPEKKSVKRKQEQFNIIKQLGKLFFVATRQSTTKKDFFIKDNFRQNIKEYQLLKLESGSSLFSYIGSTEAKTDKYVFRLAIVISIMEELKALHQKNILHCDLSAHNIMIDRKDFSVAIIDFDRTIQLKEGSDFGKHQYSYDYISYLAPETRENIWRKESDIYSVAASVFGMYIDQENQYEYHDHCVISEKEMSDQLAKNLLRMQHGDYTKRPTVDQVLDSLKKEMDQISTDDKKNFIRTNLLNNVSTYVKNRPKTIRYFFSRIFSFFDNRATRIMAANKLMVNLSKETINLETTLSEYKQSIIHSRHCWNRKYHTGKSEEMLQKIEHLQQLTHF